MSDTSNEFAGFDHSFSVALSLLKMGERVKRTNQDWFVCLMPNLHLPAERVNDRTRKFIGEGVDLNCKPYFALYNTETGEWQPGWQPTADDMLAHDWCLIP